MSLAPIRVAPGGRYFETTDGKPFLFIGPNDAISWPGLGGLFRRRDIAGAEAYIAEMAASGVTTLRLMLEYAHTGRHYFERPAGTPYKPMVQLWDDLFALCERYGLRVLLAPWDNFWMARRWHKHPYNTINGGPANGPGAFFWDAGTIQATIRRFEFVVQRWGGSGVLAAWDLFNEIHTYWGGSPAEQFDIITRMSEAIRECEERTWGFTRPQTVSIFGPKPDPEYEPLIFRHPSLDFVTTHIYSKGTIDHPVDTVAPALAMAGWVRYALERTPPGRPYTDSEHGPIHLFNDHKIILEEAFDDEYERHLMWSHLASGGAGSGMRWPARHPHLLTAGHRRALAGMAGFCALIDWRTFESQPLLEALELGSAELLRFGCADRRQAVIWLLRGQEEGNKRGRLPLRPALRDIPLTLRGMDAGSYAITGWDTLRGVATFTLAAEADGRGLLRLTLPHVGNDLALAVRASSRPGDRAAGPA